MAHGARRWINGARIRVEYPPLQQPWIQDLTPGAAGVFHLQLLLSDAWSDERVLAPYSAPHDTNSLSQPTHPDAGYMPESERGRFCGGAALVLGPLPRASIRDRRAPQNKPAQLVSMFD